MVKEQISNPAIHHRPSLPINLIPSLDNDLPVSVPGPNEDLVPVHSFYPIAKDTPDKHSAAQSTSFRSQRPYLVPTKLDVTPQIHFAVGMSGDLSLTSNPLGPSVDI